MSTSTLRLGQTLFRFRSFTPVPVLAVLAWLLFRSRGVAGPGGPEVDAWLDGLGLLVAGAGQALRFYTLGQVPEGTSGQGSVLEAKTLNTRGPYAYVRNPLYVGNLGICLGLMLVANDAWVYAVGLAFFFGEYFFIIRAEEDFLRGQFGAAFDAYCASVRRWVPRWSAATSGALRAGFDWRRALRKEHNPFAAWASGALALLAWEAWARGRWSPATAGTFLAAEAAILVAFVSIKSWKRGWLRKAAG
jgi:protein-S-isoprenylcysteine O-methyltransferase Ste14